MGVAVRPHRGEPCYALAVHQKAAGTQLLPRTFGHRPFLAGDERLVGVGVAFQDHRVGADLVAGAKLHHIVFHKVIGQHFLPPARPQAAHPPGGHKGQFIHRFFAAQLLDDANDGVAHHHAQKGHVGIGADHGQRHRQQKKYQIEIGADVIPHDLPHRFGGGMGRLVGLPGGAAALHLLRGQSGDGSLCCHGNSFPSCILYYRITNKYEKIMHPAKNSAGCKLFIRLPPVLRGSWLSDRRR